jgi:hypothetical protein
MNKALPILTRMALSPWLLAALSALPACALFMILAGKGPPGAALIVANNALLFLLLCLRLVIYASRARSHFRYPPGTGFRGGARPAALMRPERAGELRECLSARGYYWDRSAGGYLEARDTGFWWGIAAHAAIVMAIALGTYNYMTSVSGYVTRGAKGQHEKLYQDRSAFGIALGPLASEDDLPFRIRVIRHHPPSEGNVHGEADVALLDREGGGELVRERLGYGESIGHGGFVAVYGGTYFDSWLVLLSRNGTHRLLTKFMRLNYREGGPEGYSYHGFYEQKSFERVNADVWLDPVTKRHLITATEEGRTIVDNIEIHFGTARQSVLEDGILIAIRGLAQGPIMRFQKKRHLWLLGLLGALAAVALGIRLHIKPRRVWIVEAEGESRVLATRPEDVLMAIRSMGDRNPGD